MSEVEETEVPIDTHYPRALYRNGVADFRIVKDEAEAAEAAAEGFVEHEDMAEPASSEEEPHVQLFAGDPELGSKTAEPSQELQDARDLIAKLDEAGARVAAERDEAREQLGAALLQVEALTAELDELTAPAPIAEPSKIDRDAVVIPDDWRELKWQGQRSLASKLSEGPIKNGGDAVAAIEAEISRRAAA